MSTEEPNRGTSTSLLQARKLDRDREELKRVVDDYLDPEARTRKSEPSGAEVRERRPGLEGGVCCTATNH